MKCLSDIVVWSQSCSQFLPRSIIERTGLASLCPTNREREPFPMSPACVVMIPSILLVSLHYRSPPALEYHSSPPGHFFIYYAVKGYAVIRNQPVRNHRRQSLNYLPESGNSMWRRFHCGDSCAHQSLHIGCVLELVVGGLLGGEA